jgi:hypothetical protein
MATSEPGYERLGAKILSLPDVVAQSVGFMGPVFSSAFVIPLVVGVISASGKGGGVASPLSVLIAAVGVFALGWIVSSYAKQIHAAGSLYDYVTRGLGERVGTAAGWLYYGGVTVLLTGLLLLIGGYLQSTIAAEFQVNPLPAWTWTLLIIAVIAAILFFGVRLSTRSQLALALVSMVVVLIFFITVIAKLGSANSLKPFNPSSAADGWSGIFFGVLYGVLVFVGFETAANLAEEGRDLRLVLQGHQPDHPRPVVRARPARARLRLDLGAARPAVGEHPAQGPERQDPGVTPAGRPGRMLAGPRAPAAPALPVQPHPRCQSSRTRAASPAAPALLVQPHRWSIDVALCATMLHRCGGLAG